MSEQSEEDLDAVSQAIHGAVQDAMGGTLDGGMLQAWHFIGSYIGEDGEEGLIVLNDDEARVTRTLGLVRYAEILLEEEVREWREEGN